MLLKYFAKFLIEIFRTGNKRFSKKVESGNIRLANF